MTTMELLTQAKGAKAAMALADTDTKNKALLAMAGALEEHTSDILAANALDLEGARGTISEVMLDRLALSESRIAGMAKGIREVAALPDPVGEVLARVERPNGLVIERTAVPMGVIAIIYESRPNVTSDAAALALKAGSACVLRCGKEAHRSAAAIVAALREGLSAAGLPQEALGLVEDTTRASANELMCARGYVDLLIPRGGAGLIRACVDNATVPVLETGTGICHIYVDKAADQEMALDIVENAKCSRPSVCNAAEVCLVHKDIAGQFLPKLKRRLVDDRAARGEQPVELRLGGCAFDTVEGTPAGPGDFDTEFLDYILAVGIVDGVDAAMAHIAAHSTGHSEAIVTADEAAARKFLAGVDSAAVYWNASTRFTDGGEFGLGCEMGISTQKLHARGPLGLRELCTFKYVVRGSGQVR
ncbi:glutamate-5-semialdehyde dehydrogenase [Pseudoflavonifractor phocaeensis]|uniref:glutamate-5-semialdehyde dehydrogenase n=1 Tax=Pseudoflavonifractor phocaeensis TaxID=1870988 RepID=UPI001F31E78F|nr:glutamate-5-semialdehyde dehydrogenase [Pseudoflavonifractor phocaeensis]MCF2662762.1 glutamate-5-semialdehyde dehydrogenase [Pseudoflavonifractor phocaeensis]